MFAPLLICNLLNQHLSDDLKVNLATSRPELMAMIQAMAKEGTFPTNETMEDVLIERELIAHAKSTYT